MKSNYVMPKIAFFAKTSATLVTLARLVTCMYSFVSMYTENPVKSFVTIPTLKLAGRYFNNFANILVNFLRHFYD